MEHYTSFKEIDTRLKILRLQKEISLEQLYLKRQQLQAHFRVPVLSGQIRDQAKKTAIFLVASYLLKRLRTFKSRRAIET